MFSKSYPLAFSAVCLLTAALFNFVLLNSAIAQSNLPQCQGDGYWSNCFGTARYPGGARYEGEWRDGKRNGRGTHYEASGKVTTGFWQDGSYVGTTALAGNTTSNTTSAQTSSNRVRMVQCGGTFKVPVRLNDQLTLDFTVDSGASDVTVPADVVMTLVRTNTIRDADFRGEQVYVLADGSRVKSRTFILRSLRVGNQTVQNVEASVADIKGSLLLGQSFLRRFKTWSIDNTTNELVLQ